MDTNGEYGRRPHQVSVIVRAWIKDEEARDITLRCLSSLSRDDLKIILVVNELYDYEALVGLAPLAAHCVVSPENMGAVRATNIGLQLAMLDPSEFILVLDNDTRVPDGDTKWLDRWVAHFSDESVGAVGATSDYVAGLQNVANTPRTYTKAPKESVEGGPGYEGPLTVDYLISFACMYRKTALRRAFPPWIGADEIEKVRKLDPAHRSVALGSLKPEGYEPITYAWDERYEPGQCEDIDISLRISMAGYDLQVARDVYIHHEGSKSFGEQGKPLSPLIQENQKKMLEKWGPTILEAVGLIERVGE